MEENEGKLAGIDLGRGSFGFAEQVQVFQQTASSKQFGIVNFDDGVC